MDDHHGKYIKRCYELAISAGKSVIFHGDPQQFLYALCSVSLISVCFIQQDEKFRLRRITASTRTCWRTR